MDVNNQIETPSAADAKRPPQYDCGCNIGSGCHHTFGGDEHDSDHDPQGINSPIRRNASELTMFWTDVSEDGKTSQDGDEGLEDHQQERHIDAADLGHVRTTEIRRALARHHRCDCPLCPHRVASNVNDWLNGQSPRPETPASMYVESSSGEMSMASSGFLERVPSSGQLFEAMGGWAEDEMPRPPDHLDAMIAPLWLVPERIAPRQLDICIPEESEPEDGEDMI